ncbi:MAG: sigma-70 family RNA polymerase sigma factor [Deltaproteobacteria bacterium]|nr:sigma-70 family RNA polymerase sigma factor [Deltaproteobacteria bacterium]
MSHLVHGVDLGDTDRRSGQETVDRVRQGEAEAFEALVKQYQGRIFALAYRMVRSEAEAADLTQEIFVRVWEKLHTFRGEAKFSTWLLQLAGNHCKNRLKYLKRRHYNMHDPLDPPANEDDGPHRQIADPGRGPDDLVAGSRMRTLVREKLEELSEEQRTVLVLRDIEDLDYEEIADATGLPLGTVKSRIHRGRVELARLLKAALAADGI